MANLMTNSDDQCENKAKMMYSAPQNKLVTEMAPVDKMMVPVDTRRPIKTSPLPKSEMMCPSPWGGNNNF